MTQTVDTPTVSDSSTQTMRAAVVTEFGAPLHVEDHDLPTPGYGEALVKLETSGVCHTDLHAAHGDWPVKPQPPFIPGHEGYGTVVALGGGVEDLQGRRQGRQRLAVVGVRQLRVLPHRLGDAVREPAERRLQRQRQLRQYMLVNAAYAARIPDNVDPLEVAPILCAGVTVYKGLKVTDTRPGQWVAISGIGGLGHIAVQYARAMGLRVVAIDVDDCQARPGHAARRRGRGQRPHHRRRRRGPEGHRRRARRARHGRAPAGVRAGHRSGAPRRHDRVQRAAAGRLPRADLRHRAEGSDNPRLDRRHPPGHGRSAGLLRPRPDPPDGGQRPPGRHQ